MNDPPIICDEVQSHNEEITIKTNFKQKIKNFYILLAFLLITITVLIAVSIYCYLIKDMKQYIKIDEKYNGNESHNGKMNTFF